MKPAKPRRIQLSRQKGWRNVHNKGASTAASEAHLHATGIGAPALSADGFDLTAGDVVFVCYMEGVTAAVYRGLKTIKLKDGTDHVAHYVQLPRNHFSQFIDLKFVYKTFGAADASYHEMAEALTKYFRATGAIK